MDLSAIKDLHAACQAMILDVADELSSSTNVPSCDGLADMLSVPEIPYKEKWDLKMGDKVKVNCKLRDFISISQRTVGWKSEYEKVLNKVGLVTSICSEYDCHVEVLFPELSMLAEIYAGLLDKAEEKLEFNNETRFQPGEMVVIKADRSVVELLQKKEYELHDHPSVKDHLGKYGKVMAVDSEKAVYVTFSGISIVKVNPALLQKEDGELETATFENSKGIVLHDEVVITKNLENLIETQKKIKNWESWMGNLPGRTARVILVKKDDVLRVCCIRGRSFAIHSDVVTLSIEGTKPEGAGSNKEASYGVGDFVALDTKSPDIKKNFMDENGIEGSFLEYLRTPAKVVGFDEKANPEITYNSIYILTVSATAVEKVKDPKATRIEKAASELKINDEAILNLGPPSYVRDVLTKNGYSNDIANKMTSKVTFKGCLGSKHAVIQFPNRELKKIKRLNLTVPEKFLPRNRKQDGNDTEEVQNRAFHQGEPNSDGIVKAQQETGREAVQDGPFAGYQHLEADIGGSRRIQIPYRILDLNNTEQPSTSNISKGDATWFRPE